MTRNQQPAERVIEYSFDHPFAGESIGGEMKFPHGTTDEEVDEAVRDEFHNHFNYGWTDK